MAVRISGSLRTIKELCGSALQPPRDLTVPMMSGERELEGRAREKKGGEMERGEATDEGYAEMKGDAKGGGGGRRGN